MASIPRRSQGAFRLAPGTYLLGLDDGSIVCYRAAFRASPLRGIAVAIPLWMVLLLLVIRCMG